MPTERKITMNRVFNRHLGKTDTEIGVEKIATASTYSSKASESNFDALKWYSVSDG